MTLVDPQHIVFYDPREEIAPVENPQQRATVFYRPEVKWPMDKRPWVVVMMGGGFLPGSGLADDQLPDGIEDVGDPQLWSLYQMGVAVISLGYTITDEAIPGAGAFDPGTWKTTNLPGGIVEVQLDSGADVLIKSAEKDAVHFIQYLRFFGIGDLDRTPGKGGMKLRSAGMIAGGFVAWGVDRADPAAEEGTRFSTNTRIGAVMCSSCIAALPHYTNATTLRHLTDGSGGVTDTIGQGLAAPNGSFTAQLASPGWYAFSNSLARKLNALMPVYLQTGGDLVVPEPGPYGYSDFSNLLTETHPAEAVRTMRDGLRALGAEFPNGFVHGAENEGEPGFSQFVVDVPDDETAEERAAREQAWWEGILAPTPPKTAEEQVLDQLILVLEGIQEPALPTGQMVFTTIRRVVPASIWLPQEMERPSVCFATLDQEINPRGPGAGHGFVERTLTVQLEFVVDGGEDGEARARRCLADIEKAIEASNRLGCRVDLLETVRANTYLVDERKAISGGGLQVAIQYQTLRSDPYQLRYDGSE
jgi:hypothetical protein